MKRVLVVDDETSCLVLYKIYLARQGMDAHCLDSPREALAVLAREHFDAVISDMCMPEMNGLEFLASLRGSQLHEGPFIFVTGQADSPAATSYRRCAGVSAVFGKPCPFDEVAALISGKTPPSQRQADDASAWRGLAS